MRIPLVALVLCGALILAACDEDGEEVPPDPTATSTNLLPPPEPIPDDWETLETSLYSVRYPPDWLLSSQPDETNNVNTAVFYSWEAGAGVEVPTDGVKLDIIASPPELAGERPADASDFSIDSADGWIVERHAPFDDGDSPDVVAYQAANAQHRSQAVSLTAYYFHAVDGKPEVFSQILSSVRLK
jgi:hypothetical protein